MSQHFYLRNFDSEDLISFRNKEKIYRIKKFNQNCRKSIENNGKTAQGFYSTLSEEIIHSHEWITQGVECELLKLGERQWVKGRVKVHVIVEFYPDESVSSDSELDKFREEN